MVIILKVDVHSCRIGDWVLQRGKWIVGLNYECVESCLLYKVVVHTRSVHHVVVILDAKSVNLCILYDYVEEVIYRIPSFKCLLVDTHHVDVHIC